MTKRMVSLTLSIVMIITLLIGCSMPDEKEITGTGIESDYGCIAGMGFWSGVPINLKGGNKNCKYYLHCENGYLYTNGKDNFEELDTDLAMNDGDIVYWCFAPTYQEGFSKSHEQWQGDTPYVDIIIKEENKIVGYAVLKMLNYYTDELIAWRGEIIKQVEFIEKEGLNKTITEDYVKEQMELLKN